jgi:hypothetical protein
VPTKADTNIPAQQQQPEQQQTQEKVQEVQQAGPADYGH